MVSFLFITFLALLVILFGAGAAYQLWASHRDRIRFPPPGELISIDGFDVHVLCQGQGEPTVLLEAGWGNDVNTWSNIFDRLAAISQVCAYDRAGMGWSNPTPQSPSWEEYASNLGRILAATDAKPPYVFVGHSAGGMLVREYFRHFPNQIVGMVFVDSSYDSETHKFPDNPNAGKVTMKRLLLLARALAPFGILRLLGIFDNQTKDWAIPESKRQQAIALLNQTHLPRMLHRKMIRDSGEYEIPVNLGDIPVIVLSHAPRSKVDSLSDKVNEQIRTMENIWLAQQQELADMSTSGELVIAQGSGHYIHMDDPDLVVKAVADVVNKVRQGM